ncbi:hypothetical protein JCM19240_842 [Vibrio maritimus]|uniref:Uncharacterized protein n=1 Tax=Vibrio maritimus TaxID=990268 RepID=A0A090T5B2_9VIBR|nr:hypothetical protein JCM19240_842 [Vibrio maritimus]
MISPYLFFFKNDMSKGNSNSDEPANHWISTTFTVPYCTVGMAIVIMAFLLR